MPRKPKNMKLARATYTEKNALRFKGYFDELIKEGQGFVELDGGLYGLKPRTLYNRVCDALLWLCDNHDDAATYLRFKSRVRYELYDNGTLRILYLTTSNIVVHRLTDLAAADSQLGEDVLNVDPAWKEKFNTFIQSDQEECAISHRFTADDIRYIENICNQMEDIKFRVTGRLFVGTRAKLDITKKEYEENETK